MEYFPLKTEFRNTNGAKCKITAVNNHNKSYRVKHPSGVYTHDFGQLHAYVLQDKYTHVEVPDGYGFLKHTNFIEVYKLHSVEDTTFKPDGLTAWKNLKTNDIFILTTSDRLKETYTVTHRDGSAGKISLSLPNNNRTYQMSRHYFIGNVDKGKIQLLNKFTVINKTETNEVSRSNQEEQRGRIVGKATVSSRGQSVTIGSRPEGNQQIAHYNKARVRVAEISRSVVISGHH